MPLTDRDDGDEGERAEARVVEQLLHRLPQHRDPRHDDGTEHEQGEQQGPQRERLHDGAARAAAAARVRPAEVERAGEKGPGGPDAGERERRDVEGAGRPGSIRSAQARTPAPTTRVTTTTTRRRRKAQSGSVWSRGTGSTRAARKKARSSATGFIERVRPHDPLPPPPPAHAGSAAVMRAGSTVPGSGRGCGVVAGDGGGDGVVVGQRAAGRRTDELVDVVLGADDLVEQAADERLGDAGRHRGDESDPLAREVRREHRHGHDRRSPAAPEMSANRLIIAR